MATRLEDIIQSANISESEEILQTFTSDPDIKPSIRPRSVIKIARSSEIPLLVKWARETNTPLIPVSSGRPHLRGDTLPSEAGAVIVDLSELKQIIRIDRRNRVAMVEPGVTFSQLIPELDKAGLCLNPPLIPRSTKSVIASMLEREPVLMPLYQWDAIDPLSCIEVTFGTGDVFRTGAAAGPGTVEEQWAAKQAQVNPMGPGQTDFARIVQGAQGTIGIVSWATLRCEAKPSLEEPFLIGSGDLNKLNELIYRLMWLKSVNECLVLSKVELAAIQAQSPGEYVGWLNVLPPWILVVNLAGYQYFPQDKLNYQKKDLMEAAVKNNLDPQKSLCGISADALLKTLTSPSREPYWKLAVKGGCRELFFLTKLELVPGFIRTMYSEVEKRGFSTADVGIYVQPMVQGTSCHCEFDIFYNPADTNAESRARSVYLGIGEAVLQAGAFFSRPYGEMADPVYRNDTETTIALRKIKKIFDPGNILNPGKLCF